MLLKKIRTKLYLNTPKKALSILDGEYVSALKGSSHDFDELKEYQYGDNVRDIDWKSSARTNTTLIKKHTATKKHQVLFILDGGIKLLTQTSSNQPKYETAITTIGILGHIALQHRDPVALITGDTQTQTFTQFRDTETHLEYMLQNINNQYQPENTQNLHNSNLNVLLDLAAQRLNKHTIIVILTDMIPLQPELLQRLETLNKRNQCLWITIPDSDPFITNTKTDAIDVETQHVIPQHLRKSKKLREIFEAEETIRLQNVQETLKNYQIAQTTILNEIPAQELIDLLHKQNAQINALQGGKR